MFRPLLVLVTVFCAANSQDGNNADVFTSEQTEAIENVLRNVMACRGVPGLTMSVVKAGKKEWVKALGKADLETGSNVTADTKFAIASLTKAFTTILLGILMDEHKNVTWSTPLKHILNDFRMPTEYMTNHMTLTDVVSHRTGISSQDVSWVADAFSRDDLLRRVQYFRPVMPFRSGFMYNNIVFSIAGKVVEKLSGKSWEETIQERIFQPLGMTSSTFYDRDAPCWEGYAKPYGRHSDAEPLWSIDQLAVSGCHAAGPAVSIASTANDITKWLTFLTSGGYSNATHRLLSEAQWKILFKPVVTYTGARPDMSVELPHNPVTHSNDNYGRGWFVGYYRGYRAYSHTGSMYGYETHVTVIPDISAAIYTSLNGPKGIRASLVQLVLHDYLSDILLEKSTWLNASSMCSFPQPWKTLRHNLTATVSERDIDQSLPPRRPLEEYTGVYGNQAYGNITFFVNQSNGRLQMNYGKHGKFLLFPQSEAEKFNVETLNPLAFLLGLSSKYTSRTYIEFQTNEDNEISKVRTPVFSWASPPVFVRNLKFEDITHQSTIASITCGGLVSDGTSLRCHVVTYICILIFVVGLNFGWNK